MSCYDTKFPEIDYTSWDGEGENTAFHYLYRDANNFKQFESVVLPGRMTKQDAEFILLCQKEKDGFIPSEVGLEDLQERMVNGYDESVDHPYHEIELIAITDDEPTLDLDVAYFIEWFNQ